MIFLPILRRFGAITTHCSMKVEKVCTRNIRSRFLRLALALHFSIDKRPLLPVRYPSEPRSMASTAMKVMMALALAFLSMMLHGCGCTEDTVKKCTDTMTAAVSNDMCKASQDWVKCIKDKSCCSEKGVADTLATFKKNMEAISCKLDAC